ncbi:MAG TPA: hypothetical protein VFV55_02100, partial [Usitatibacteraceae bacterium]|nr:hypothetical protein [Usitatibacteraceae bacterium]
MRTAPSLFLAASVLAAGCGSMSPADHAQHMGHDAAVADGRQVVDFPEPMRTHTLSNMRDHLAALQEIQQALAE